MIEGLNGLKWNQSFKRNFRIPPHLDLLRLWPILNHPWTRDGEATVDSEAPSLVDMCRQLHALIINGIHESRRVMIDEIKHCLKHESTSGV